MNNRYSLGVPLTKEQENEFYASGKGRGLNAVRLKEYWLAHHLSKDAPWLRERFVEAYGFTEEEMYWFDDNDEYFVTDDVDLAAEMIRVLNMDFVHDFKTGVFFFDVYARHELIMNYLYEGIKKVSSSDVDDAAALYVEGGYGCFHSTQNEWIMLGEDVALPKYLSQFKSKVRYL